MLRRDFLQAEIEKLAQVLAKIIGLKNDGKYEEAEDLNVEILQESFDLSWDTLTKTSVEDFEALLKSKNYPKEKLDILSQLLFESVYPFDSEPETDTILHKVLGIFSLLEEEHHIQSLDNLNRRVMIDKFLNTRQYE